METIGVLGGMGPAATADFYRRIVEATCADRDQGHLHVLIDADPAVPDRTEYLTGGGEDPGPMLTRMAQGLAGRGATLLVIACNSASPLTARVAASVDVPVVDWVWETVHSVRQVRPDTRRVGLLATVGAVRSRVYQDGFTSAGVEVVVPDAERQRRLMEVIYAVKAGEVDHAAAASVIEDAVEATARTGAGLGLLACTELSMLCAGSALHPSVPVLDTAQLVAERVVALAGARVDPARGRLVGSAQG